MAKVQRGFVFTHQTLMDPFWQPDLEKGETYREHAPRATMVVTQTGPYTVFYDYADADGKRRGRGAALKMDRKTFEERYAR